LTAGALILTGAPGAGKSTVLAAVSNLLAADGVVHGALETEQLMWGDPWLSFEQGMEQLATLVRMQMGYGRAVFLLAATTETAAQLDGVRAAVAAPRSVVVALRARPETVRARILAREPEHWSGREALAEHAAALATTIPALGGIDLVLDTDGAHPVDVARRVRDAL
jgi:broad-specificity NMP kinase